MRKSVALKVEKLEDRAVPAVFGHPWADASHVTLSFVPDGTSISDVASNLDASLSGIGGDAAKVEILRAIQTWVANANLNVGLVADDGSPFDAAGQVQGDPRFGDIRIGGRAWAADVLSLTTPFNYFNTESGNIALNTAAAFSVGGTNGTNDLYTVSLQEAAHALGVANSPNITSAMYEYYQGARAGISAEDIASIQALYGVRQPDAFEGLGGNDTLATATTYTGPLTADLTTATDVDTYRFTTSASGGLTVVHLNAAGISLVQAQVQVLNQFGQVLAQGAAQDVTNNDVTLTLSNLQPMGTYYVKVSSNRSDVFGVGAYKLSIDGANAGSGGSSGGSMLQLSGDFGTFATAAVLPPTVTVVNQQIDDSAQFTRDTLTNSTYFRVHAPAAAPGQVVHLVVSVYDLGQVQDAQVTVFDAAQNQLNARILASGTGNTVIEVDGVQSNTDYFIRVNTTTSFKFAVDFTTKDVPFELGSTGGGTSQSSTLNVAQSQVMFLALSADGTSGATVTMTIRDSDGNVVCVLTSSGGTTRSTSVFLAAGRYRVAMTMTADVLNPLVTPTYRLSAAGITDPIGAQVADPTQNPTGGGGGSIPPPDATGALLYWVADSPGQGSLWF